MGTGLVQLSRAYGKRVIGVVSSADRGIYARAQGCHDIIDRTSMNSWLDPNFRKAVAATGRKKFVIAGLGPRRA